MDFFFLFYHKETLMSRSAYCVLQLTIAASPFILLVSACGVQPALTRSARRKTDALDFPFPLFDVFPFPNSLCLSPPSSPEGDECIDQMRTRPSFLPLPAHLRLIPSPPPPLSVAARSAPPTQGPAGRAAAKLLRDFKYFTARVQTLPRRYLFQ